MRQDDIDLTEWVRIVFGEASWGSLRGGPGDDRYYEVCGPDRTTLTRLTEVFVHAQDLLAPYPDGALGQAFWNLSFDAFYGLVNESIEWDVRQGLILSLEVLFRDFFAKRCEPVLGHLSESDNPLNLACYMWWDFDCWGSVPDPLTRNPLDCAYLESMRAILRIDHAACQESALHGLGHWHSRHSRAVEEIIDEFLVRERDVPQSLREYARNARRGCVQ